MEKQMKILFIMVTLTLFGIVVYVSDAEASQATTRSASGEIVASKSENIIPISAPAGTSRMLVVFRDRPQKAAILRARGQVKNEYQHVPATSVTVPFHEIPKLKRDPNVLAVEADVEVRLAQAQREDWGIPKTKASESWKSGYTGKNVKIAIVDTGIAQHPDLVIAGGASFVSYTTSYADDQGHGTHVAGIIGARNNAIGTVGIAPESSLYAVKVMNQSGSGRLSDIIAGIDWAISQKVDIINMSLGSAVDSLTMKAIVDKAYNAGILVVASAGNSGNATGSGDTVMYPAKYDSVIAVGATTSADQRATFSSTGNAVEVAAPGAGILSTYLNNGYATMSGTSMASPYVAGNLALLKQANPTLNHQSLRKKLTDTVRDLGQAGRDTHFGFGLIQAPTESSGSTPSPQKPPVITDRRTTSELTVTGGATRPAGSPVLISVKVLDAAKVAIPEANVRLTLIHRSGTIMMINARTASDGVARVSLNSKANQVGIRQNVLGMGGYHVIAVSQKPPYLESAALTLMEIR